MLDGETPPGATPEGARRFSGSKLTNKPFFQPQEGALPPKSQTEAIKDVKATLETTKETPTTSLADALGVGGPSKRKGWLDELKDPQAIADANPGDRLIDGQVYDTYYPDNLQALPEPEFVRQAEELMKEWEKNAVEVGPTNNLDHEKAIKEYLKNVKIVFENEQKGLNLERVAARKALDKKYAGTVDVKGNEGVDKRKGWRDNDPGAKYDAWIKGAGPHSKLGMAYRKLQVQVREANKTQFTPRTVKDSKDVIGGSASYTKPTEIPNEVKAINPLHNILRWSKATPKNDAGMKQTVKDILSGKTPLENPIAPPKTTSTK